MATVTVVSVSGTESAAADERWLQCGARVALSAEIGAVMRWHDFLHYF